MRLRGKENDLVIIQVCMPITRHPEEVDELYEIIKEIIEEEKKGACIMVMGDWNASVGEGQYKNIVGKYALGIEVLK